MGKSFLALIKESLALSLSVREAALPRETEAYFDGQSSARGDLHFLLRCWLIVGVCDLAEECSDLVKKVVFGREGTHNGDDEEGEEAVQADDISKESCKAVHNSLLNLDLEA